MIAERFKNGWQRLQSAFLTVGHALLIYAVMAVGISHAEPDDGNGDDAVDTISEIVELPIESIRLVADRLSLQDSLELSASILLPDACHSFERLEGMVDEESQVVTIVAVGNRQGKSCSQSIEMKEAALLMYPLPREGVWIVEAQHFDDVIQTELTVGP